MANDINQVVMVGRLTRDPELRQVGSGTSLCSFGIANNRVYVTNGEKREEVSFFNCTAWGRLGEIINQYCQKGKQIAITGRLRQNSYENQEGKKVSTVEVVVENMQLLGSRSDNAADMGNSAGMQSGGSFSQSTNQGYQQNDQQAFGGQSQQQAPAFSGGNNLNQGSGFDTASDDDIPF